MFAILGRASFCSQFGLVVVYINKRWRKMNEKLYITAILNCSVFKNIVNGCLSSQCNCFPVISRFPFLCVESKRVFCTYLKHVSSETEACRRLLNAFFSVCVCMCVWLYMLGCLSLPFRANSHKLNISIDQTRAGLKALSCTDGIYYWHTWWMCVQYLFP